MQLPRKPAASHTVIDRNKVYELGGYPADRSLRGFTRPINRIAQSYRDEGALPDEALDVLEAIYSSTADNPSMATGFAVPREVLPLVQTAAKRDDVPSTAEEVDRT